MLGERLGNIRKRELNDAAKRSEALAELEIAFVSAAETPVTPDQVADLADALDAFKEHAYGVAAALARASTKPRRRIADYRRPDSMSPSITELRDAFARLQGAKRR